jgi:hypothetical protein
MEEAGFRFFASCQTIFGEHGRMTEPDPVLDGHGRGVFRGDPGGQATRRRSGAGGQIIKKTARGFPRGRSLSRFPARPAVPHRFFLSFGSPL